MCDEGVALAGACVPRAVAASVCEGDLEGGACTRARCPEGQIPLPGGPCVPLAGLRTSASHPWIVPEERDALACPPHALAHARTGTPRPTLLCLPETACLPGATWIGGRCVADARCPPGHVPVREGCVPVLTANRVGGRIDLARWVGAAIGADGGEGSSLVCGTLGRNPHLAGVLDRSVSVDLQITVDAPGNDASAVEVRVHARPPEVAGLTPPVADVLAAALRSLGSATSATRARTNVICRVAGALPPERVAVGPKL